MADTVHSVLTVPASIERFRDHARSRGMTPYVRRRFREIILRHYETHGRSFPWRTAPTPYRVFVSEIMLQQTRADRVARKFEPFIRLFPGFDALAAASRRDLLHAWQGLGYNRRALLLQDAARTVVTEYRGVLPGSIDTLRGLPGIGQATACSIAAFAFHTPVVFLETNIRCVYIYFFFAGSRPVHDRHITAWARYMLDRRNPARWYNALMDYGSMLKKQGVTEGRRSMHHTLQERFTGSDRQIRGILLRRVLQRGSFSATSVCRELGRSYGGSRRIRNILADLAGEGFLQKKGDTISVAV